MINESETVIGNEIPEQAEAPASAQTTAGEEPRTETLAEVLARLKSDTDENADAVGELQQAAGRSQFIPNLEDSRPAPEVIPAIGGTALLLIHKTSKSPGEGGTIDGPVMKMAFGERALHRAHRTQVVIILANGQQLVGYAVTSKVRTAFYMPKQLIPAGITLPKLGEVLPIKVTALLIG